MYVCMYVCMYIRNYSCQCMWKGDQVVFRFVFALQHIKDNYVQ